MSVRFERFMERSGVLPTTKFAYRKSLSTCGTLHSALECGHEARIVQIDFCPAFDGVNYQHVLNKLCSFIGGSV